MALKLSLIHLQLALELDRTRSLTETGRRLRLTTPAVSYRLKEAQRRLGLPLFERHGHDWQPTAAGERVVLAARAAIDEILAMEADLRAGLKEPQTTLRIGARGYSAYRWLPAFAKTYAKQQNSLRIEIVDDSLTGTLESLRERRVDVAIAAGQIRAQWAVVVPLFRDELVAVLPVGHALAARRWLEPQDFLRDPYITYSAAAERGHEGDQFFRAAHVQPRNRVQVGLAEAVIEWVRHGFGISILTSWAVAEHVQNGSVAIRPLTQRGLSLEWFAVVRRETGSQRSVLFARALAEWCTTYPPFSRIAAQPHRPRAKRRTKDPGARRETRKPS
ncbi:MAG TPA: LysR family transcriptional regulator [Steroidobacteraceae bacterium]|nr:LysR family transcriptional regulator [Steroidobacteraceae bacterium]